MLVIEFCFWVVLQSLNYQNPSLFSTSTSAKSWWRCALSATALVGAIASTSSCVTVVACGFALVAVAAASLSVKILFIMMLSSAILCGLSLSLVNWEYVK